MHEVEIDFKKYSSVKIGTKLPVKIAQNINEALNLHNESYRIIGKANNILLSDNPACGLRLFQLGREFDYIKEVDLSENLKSENLIEIGARCVAKKAFLYFREKNLSGLEFLDALPGSIGGIVQMNAGMKAFEVKDIIHSVCVNGEWILRHKIPFYYRNSGINGVITAARFHKIEGFKTELPNLFKSMRSNQPKGASAGSCFKNPQGQSAGRLLENVGLRGFRLGEMGFSQMHANFLMNYGSGKKNGSFDDAIKLINLAKERVWGEFGVKLECEILIWE